MNSSATDSAGSGSEQGGHLMPPGWVPGVQGQYRRMGDSGESPTCPEPRAPLSAGGVTSPSSLMNDRVGIGVPGKQGPGNSVRPSLAPRAPPPPAWVQVGPRCNAGVGVRHWPGTRGRGREGYDCVSLERGRGGSRCEMGRQSSWPPGEDSLRDLGLGPGRL